MELFKLHVRLSGGLAGYPRRTKLCFSGINLNDQGQPQINLLVLAGDAKTHVVLSSTRDRSLIAASGSSRVGERTDRRPYRCSTYPRPSVNCLPECGRTD